MKCSKCGKESGVLLVPAHRLSNCCNAEIIKTPKQETVKEWENRTGESYPDDAPIWLSEKVAVENGKWSVYRLKEYGRYKNSSREYWKVIVANHRGKPEEIIE